MIKIDNQSFNVPILKMGRKAEVLDKYANRTESGDLEREILGVYFNYTLEFGFPNKDRIEYHRLWNKLTEPTEFHSVTVYDETGPYSFTAYITGVSDEIVRVFNHETEVICNGLKCTFTAKQPARVST